MIMGAIWRAGLPLGAYDVPAPWIWLWGWDASLDCPKLALREAIQVRNSAGFESTCTTGITVSCQDDPHMPSMGSGMLHAASWWNSTRGVRVTDMSRPAGPTRKVLANASKSGTFGSQELCFPRCDHAWHFPRSRGASTGLLFTGGGSAAAEPSRVACAIHEF